MTPRDQCYFDIKGCNCKKQAPPLVPEPASVSFRVDPDSYMAQKMRQNWTLGPEDTLQGA